METYIFTFGSGQELEGFCVRVIGTDYYSCREIMCNKFGEEWCFQYSLADWEKWIEKAKKIGIPVEEEILTLS